MKKRTGDPWIPAPAYGRLLPAFTVNLIVRDIDTSLAFYQTVLKGMAHYVDPDFAAIRLGNVEMMLHADHAYEANPWSPALAAGTPRGLGAELRLLGFDPDEVAERARAVGGLFKEVSIRGHGWREAMVIDPDGYVWAIGELIPPQA